MIILDGRICILPYKGRFRLPTTHISIFDNHLDFTYIQNGFAIGKLFATLSTSHFTHASMSWSFGQLVLYMISPKDLDVVVEETTSLILIQACFSQAQQTCHKHKKTFVWGHTILCCMQ
jgi:hypothetical protein